MSKKYDKILHKNMNNEKLCIGNLSKREIIYLIGNSLLGIDGEKLYKDENI